MIPMAQIIHWRQFAPWSDDLQVEQDLILSRIIVELFSEPFLVKELLSENVKIKNNVILAYFLN